MVEMIMKATTLDVSQMPMTTQRYDEAGSSEVSAANALIGTDHTKGREIAMVFGRRAARSVYSRREDETMSNLSRFFDVYRRDRGDH